MENLKSAIPESLKQAIGDTTVADDLPRSCSSLLHFLLHFPPFRQTVDLLAAPEEALCGKSKDEALQLKNKANQCFASGDFPNCSIHYSEALRVAPVDAYEAGKNLVATLYLNRAFAFHKMDLLAECVRDCDRALRISPGYAKAWYRRGKANASLGNCKEESNDLNVAKILESSSGGKNQIEAELTRLFDRDTCIMTPPLEHTAQNLNDLDGKPGTKLQCVSTPDKARGMISTSNSAPASLVHNEEPFAAIILKSCRETHCHYCMNELPVDRVPCTSCSMPFYCSERCRLRARGNLPSYPKSHGIQEKLPYDLEKYVNEVIFCDDVENLSEHIPEHRHECHGSSWPLVLPSEIVLAGRLFVKCLLQRRGSLDVTNHIKVLDLAHHYSQMSRESKLELHIYSTLLISCLEHSRDLEVLVNGISIAQIVILVSQIRVNSMSIVRMKSAEVHGLETELGKSSSEAPTSIVEQVKVGQAIYKTGSLFNHSCQPNVHAYFLSRTLFIRTTEFVPAESPLELSYGPQVGQWDCKARIQSLEDEYSFRCQCVGCSEVNYSDLALNAYSCVEQNCSGVVLDSSVLNWEKLKIKARFKTEGVDNDEVNDVAPNTFFDRTSLADTNPGQCLKCGAYRDLQNSSSAVNKAQNNIRMLETALASEEISRSILSDATQSFEVLKSTLHEYNRSIAEVEDTLARANCLVGDLQSARDYCKASIKILEKLYGSNHVVIGHELAKLASIHLQLGRDSSSHHTITRLHQIFTCYYGSHAHLLFPFLISLTH